MFTTHRQITPFWRVLLFAVLAPGWLASAVGQVAAAADPTPALTPELQAMLDQLQPQWMVSLNARLGAGYKDNVALSAARPEASGFVRGSLDALVMHPSRFPDGRIDYSAYVMAEGTHFFSSEAVDHEAMASVMFEWRYHLDDRLKFSLNASGFYFDQVLDQSNTVAGRDITQSKRTVPMVRPTLRWAPQAWWWIEAQGEARRETYHDGFNNARLGAESLTLGWKPTKRIEVQIAGEETRRRFASREQNTARGRPLPGTHLHIVERDGEGRVNIAWDRAGHWKTVTRVDQLDYEDNGTGYFNYRQRRARQKLEWETGAWSVHVEASAKRLDFELQDLAAIFPGPTPPLRVQEKFTAELRIDRRLSKRWSVYGEYSWERSRCNDPIESYRMNEGLLGATWTWEK